METTGEQKDMKEIEKKSYHNPSASCFEFGAFLRKGRERSREGETGECTRVEVWSGRKTLREINLRLSMARDNLDIILN